MDESKLNDLLDMPQQFPSGVLVLLNRTTSTNQDAAIWNPAGSGSMWTEFTTGIQAIAHSEEDRLTTLATQNALQVTLILYVQISQ